MRNIVITGGTRGIGAALVRKFRANGDTVHFLYEKSDDLALCMARETGAIPHKCDVADENAVKETFSAIGPVDVLVNNAGIVDYGPINWVEPQAFRRLMDVNVSGSFFCCQQVLSGMLGKQKGVIINLSSMWGRVGSSCEVAYSTSKAAIIGMTKSLAKELGPSGIRVNAVAPGVIVTDMVKNVAPEVLEELRQETPLETLGKPEDVAQAVFYLSSDAASFITGAVLDVNGGFVV